MQLLQNYCKNFCKILQENALTSTNSCKIKQDMFGSCENFARVVCYFQELCVFAKFLQKLYSVWTNLIHNVFVIDVIASDTYVSKYIPLQKCKWNLTVFWEPRFTRRFGKGQQWSHLKGRNNITLEKHCFTLYFYLDKLRYYKTYDFRKFLIPDGFKHVLLQNTFNWCKIHQILPLTVDYACFLVKCINYQNVMSLKIIYFLQDLARFLQKLHFLQETHLLQNFARNEIVLQDCCKNFARLIFTRFLQKLFFLWTREVKTRPWPNFQKFSLKKPPK